MEVENVTPRPWVYIELEKVSAWWNNWYRGRTCYITAASDINSELILRFQPRWKTDIEVMIGKTNTKAKYSTYVGTRYENEFVNNFETHGTS